MTRDTDLILTLALLGAVLALILAPWVAGRPAARRARLSDEEVRRRFPAIHDRRRGSLKW